MPRRSSSNAPVCASCGAEAAFQPEESEFDGSQGGFWMHADDGTSCVECAGRHGKYSGGSYYDGDFVMPSKEWKKRKQ